MTDLNPGATGAKRQSWAHDNPRDILLGLIKANKSWNERQIFEAFFEEVVDNEDYIKVIVGYWFANNYLSLMGGRRKRKGAATGATVANNIKKRIEQEAQVLLLELTMPNGKRLADCTGNECKLLSKKVGGWLSRIADKIKPTDIVGRVLTEKQVRQLYA